MLRGVEVLKWRVGVVNEERTLLVDWPARHRIRESKSHEARLYHPNEACADSRRACLENNDNFVIAKHMGICHDIFE